jgi:peptidoglycan/LPS O-acetylase OafA/YrhL
MSATMNRIPELDGLRGIAIGMVIIWHYFGTVVQVRPASPLSYLVAATRLTWSGVDLFFVLSGFLIGGILLDARGATNYFRVFYRRRFFRIVPIYAVVLLVFPTLAVFRHAAHPTISTAASSPPWYMYWTFTQNLWMAVTSSLGTNSLGMTWSLAVEEQFYLTLPVLVCLLSPRQLRRTVLVGIVLAPLLRLAIYFLWPHNWGASYVLMPCRADALLLGVFAAILLRDPLVKARIQNTAFFSVAFPILLLGMFFLLLRSPDYGSPLMSTLGYSWLALLYATTLVLAVTRTGSSLSKILRQKWLCWLGSIAYGTYLLHQGAQRLVFRFVSIDSPVVTGIYSLLITIVALAFTLLVARISWIHFERPLDRIGHLSHYKFLRDTPSSELAASP